MGLNQEREELRSHLSRLLETVAEARSRAGNLPDVSLSEMSREIETVLELCYDAIDQFHKSLAQTEAIQSIIGQGSDISSIVAVQTWTVPATSGDRKVENILTKTDNVEREVNANSTGISVNNDSNLANEIQTLVDEGGKLDENLRAMASTGATTLSVLVFVSGITVGVLQEAPDIIDIINRTIRYPYSVVEGSHGTDSDLETAYTSEEERKREKRDSDAKRSRTPNNDRTR